jgi:hypothetical protein
MVPREAQQALVASRVGGHDHLPQQATHHRDCGRRQGVTVGVDADDAVHPVSQHTQWTQLLPARQSRVSLEGHRTANL